MSSTTPNSPTPRPETAPLRPPHLPITVRSYGLTDRGRVRPTNEDHFLIAELARTLTIRQTSLPQPGTQYGRNRGHLLLVADGMGGHRAGEVASALTVASIEAFVLHLLKRFSNLQATDEQTVLKDFQAALQQADDRLFEEAVQHPEFAGMGTTLTLVLVSGWKLFMVHAGDSRCYLFRGGQLRQLTADHTIAGELARRGVIDPAAVGRHQLRHVVTNVLGGGHSGVQADVQRLELETGDLVLLCSDGLSDMVPDDRITAIMGTANGPQSACEQLVAEANDRGGKDNITAVVAWFGAF